MSKHIAIVAATEKEIEPFRAYLKNNEITHSPTRFQLNDIVIDIVISGIGILPSTYTLMNYLMEHKPDAWIQTGIGGAFDTSLEIGKTYLIESEILVDFGAEDSDGRIISPFELGWLSPDQYPYTEERLICPYVTLEAGIPFVTGMTTLYAHGYTENIDKISMRPHGQIENMEGAAFFYVSLMKNIPFLSIRAVSNLVTSRDTSMWEIEKAIEILCEKTLDLIKRQIIPTD